MRIRVTEKFNYKDSLKYKRLIKAKKPKEVNFIFGKEFDQFRYPPGISIALLCLLLEEDSKEMSINIDSFFVSELVDKILL